MQPVLLKGSISTNTNKSVIYPSDKVFSEQSQHTAPTAHSVSSSVDFSPVDLRPGDQQLSNLSLQETWFSDVFQLKEQSIGALHGAGCQPQGFDTRSLLRLSKQTSFPACSQCQHRWSIRCHSHQWELSDPRPLCSLLSSVCTEAVIWCCPTWLWN